MASVAYFVTGGVGDWYECVTATTPGESPASHPAKWRKLEIPAFMESELVSLALRFLLRGDGQSDKGHAELRVSVDAVEQLRVRFADPPRMKVFSR